MDEPQTTRMVEVDDTQKVDAREKKSGGGQVRVATHEMRSRAAHVHPESASGKIVLSSTSNRVTHSTISCLLQFGGSVMGKETIIFYNRSFSATGF